MLSIPQNDSWLFSMYSLRFGFLSGLRHLSLFHLLSSIYDFLIDVSASIHPIFVDLCLKNYWKFQWDFGFGRVPEEDELGTCV